MCIFRSRYQIHAALQWQEGAFEERIDGRLRIRENNDSLNCNEKRQDRKKTKDESAISESKFKY